MTLSTALTNAARTLITTFGNDASLYPYSGATTTTNTEGEDTVTDWGSASSIKVVDSSYVREELLDAVQGQEVIGEDDKIVRDDVTITVRDRVTSDGREFKVVQVRPIITQTTVVAQIVRIVRATSTTIW